jgi:hypothetical protein
MNPTASGGVMQYQLAHLERGFAKVTARIRAMRLFADGIARPDSNANLQGRNELPAGLQTFVG